MPPDTQLVSDSAFIAPRFTLRIIFLSAISLTIRQGVSGKLAIVSQSRWQKKDTTDFTDSQIFYPGNPRHFFISFDEETLK
jgi:hypothetical protein